MLKGSRDSNQSVSERGLGGINQFTGTFRRSRGFAFFAGLGLLLAAPTGVAGAQQPESKNACLSSYESAQLLRQQSHLVEAREALGLCSRQECPPLVRQDCGNWLEEIDKAIPSVIVQASVDGAETSNVKVSLDGKVVKTRLDGKAIPTDPGSHKIKFETAGFPPIEQTVVVREGEHYRPISAEFLTHKTPPPPVEMTRPIPTLVWVMGAVTVAGAAGFATMGLIGNQKKSSLEKSNCAPFCASSDVDVAHTDYMAADISLAVGVAALVAGSIFFLTRPEVPVQLGVAPSPSGMSFSASGHF
jgi:hypothetical protein